MPPYPARNTRLLAQLRPSSNYEFATRGTGRKKEAHAPFGQIFPWSTSVYYLFLVYLRCSSFVFCSGASPAVTFESWNSSLNWEFPFVFCSAFSNNSLGADGFLNIFLAQVGDWDVKLFWSSSLLVTSFLVLLLCFLLASSLEFVLVVLRHPTAAPSVHCWLAGRLERECGGQSRRSPRRRAWSRHYLRRRREKDMKAGLGKGRSRRSPRGGERHI